MKKLTIVAIALLLAHPLWAGYTMQPPVFKVGLSKQIDITIVGLPQTMDGAKLVRADTILGYWISGELYPQSYPIDLKTMTSAVPAKVAVPFVKAHQPKDWTGIDFIRKVDIDAQYLADGAKEPTHLKVSYEWPHDAARIKTLSVPFVKLINPSSYKVTITQDNG